MMTSAAGSRAQYRNAQLAIDIWDMAGCRVTPDNVNHPLIQEFFHNMGATAQDTGKGYMFFKGSMELKGEDLHNFLMSRGVDLRANPHALDTPEAIARREAAAKTAAEQAAAKNTPKPITPAFNNAKAEAKNNAVATNIPVASENVDANAEDDSLYSRFVRLIW